MIDESAFQDCDGLEECLIDNDAVLVKIGKGAFAHCRSLRSFCFPKTVWEVGENCFVSRGLLHLLIFVSGVSLKEIVRARTLDEALEHIGFADISSLFEIYVNAGAVDLDFAGWVSVGDTGSTVVITQTNI
jgi:hypothetical protein